MCGGETFLGACCTPIPATKLCKVENWKTGRPLNLNRKCSFLSRLPAPLLLATRPSRVCANTVTKTQPLIFFFNSTLSLSWTHVSQGEGSSLYLPLPEGLGQWRPEAQ